MKTIILVSACLLSFSCFGQTKLIAFRSHSGSNSTFRNAIEQNLFDTSDSNFGIVQHPITKIDTVLLQDKNTILVIRRQYQTYGGDIPIDPKEIKRYRQTFTREQAPGLFKNDNPDSVKNALIAIYSNLPYHMPARLDSTYFVGFHKNIRPKTAQHKR